MTTTAGVDSSTAAAATSATSRKSLAQNFDTFLTMLTTQLKHQDPLSPMDSTEFTNQLVQFAGVEQQINANSNLEKLISATSLNTKSQAINYIGHFIEADTSAVPLQDGAASFSVTLDAEPASVVAVIKNADGDIVANKTLQKISGRQEVTWDGKDKDGNQLDDGLYTITVSALDAEGEAIESAVTVYGKVTDVASDDTGTLIGMGKVVVNIDKILTVRDSASVQSDTDSTDSTDTADSTDSTDSTDNTTDETTN